MKSFPAFFPSVTLIVFCTRLGLAANPPSGAGSRPAEAVPAKSSATEAASDRTGPYVLDDKHKLAPGDKISFRILEDKDPPELRMVTDSGELDIPYVGRVSAAGKTCKALAKELETRLVNDLEYYYRATVQLAVDAVNKVRGKVYVLGQVKAVGAIDLPAEEDFTAGKAILRAGGFGDFAKKTRVKLVRPDADGKKQEFELNMEAILEDGKTELDKTLKDGDYLIVPSRSINF